MKMKNRWLLGTAAAALVVAGAVSAQAADLPTRKEAPAPVFVPPPFTWTGFYVGLNAGGIWSTSKEQATFYAAGFPFLTQSFGGNLGSGESGFLGGAQAGYNWQAGAAVFGVETDWDWTSLKKDHSNIGATFVDLNGLNDFLTTNGEVKMDWLGTTRARVGFVATPDNRLMFYGTGGVAYAGGKANLNVFDARNGWYWSGEKSDTRFGWTIGAGVEYAVTNNITIKGEYLYYNLGSTNAVTVPNVAASTFVPGSYGTAKVTYEGSVFRAGVNYKF